MFTQKKRNFLYSLIAILLVITLGAYFALGNSWNSLTQTRTISLTNSELDYATMFNEFDDAELIVNEDNNQIKFSGTQTLDASLFNEVDLVALTSSEDSDGIAEVIDNIAYSKLSEKVEAARKELKRRRPTDTIIYRKGSDMHYNLTPRPIEDTNGLSFFSDIHLDKCVITTKELVNATGSLQASGAGHVLVSPTAGDIAAWQATKETANTNPHLYTLTLHSIVIRAY